MNRPAGTVANRAWIAYLALGLVASTVYLFAPGLQGNGPLFNVISGSSAIAILLGLSLHRPVAPWVWRWFAIGQALFFLGDVYTYSYPLVSGDEVPFPSAGDALYLLVYPALMTGVLLAVRRRNPQGDRAGVIDALIITVGMALLSWVFLMAPYVHDATLSPLAKMVSIAYPLGDVLLLAATLRLAFDGGRRRGSFYLLIASVGALLATDAAYGFALLNGTYDHQLIYDAGWIAYYLLWGAAAMHPTMQDFVEATPDRERRLGWERLGLLTVASLVAPAILLVREAGRGDVDLLVIVAASIVVFLFVIARVAGLVTQNERTVMRERALRLANLALVKATTPEEIASAALGTARALVAGVGEARVCVERPDGLVPMTAEPGGVHAALSGGAVTLLELAAILPNEPVTLPAAVHAELDLPADAQRANVFPLAARGERRGLLIAASATPLSPILVEALDALSASVSLALESAALIEQAHRRENEARFASLVRNASDVITVVDRDGRVLYQSPSIERILGFAADDVSATLFEDLLIPGDRGLLRKVLQTTGDGARSHAFDCTLSHRDGRALKFEIVATDLLDDEHVRGIVLNGRDVSERARFEEELAHQAFHDTVTGLPNRALFADRVEHALARAVREGTSIAVIFLDLDDFKTINDSLGHAAGDEVLKHVGARLQETVRATDTAARFGGDEFAILLEDVGDPATAIDLAERLVEGFEMPIAVVDKDLSVRASIGIALSGADAEQAPRDADELIRNADAAMYICKRDGKGGYRVFEAAMHERVLERLELRLELQRAIDEGQFELHFQPVVRLRDGRVAGMEALVRWHHPTRGLVQPGQFIPLAEEMGVIVDLGRWVTREACHQAAQLHASGEAGPDFTISVNLSVRQLQHPDVVADVRAALESSGIDPKVLVLEITESVMMADYQLARRRLGQLKDLGVRIAMDDFGTGYSSLSYLSRFPVDILKMDRSFLASDASPQAADLAAAIISLGESLKLEVVAEGIELPGQYDSLRELGCDLGQGFLIARPMDVDATRAWLADEAERAARTEHDADAA